MAIFGCKLAVFIFFKKRPFVQKKPSHFQSLGMGVGGGQSHPMGPKNGHFGCKLAVFQPLFKKAFLKNSHFLVPGVGWGGDQLPLPGANSSHFWQEWPVFAINWPFFS